MAGNRVQVEEFVKRRRKVLGQAAPLAATDTDLYTVPEGYTATGLVHAFNRGTVAALMRVAVRPGGAALAVQHYLVFDQSVAAQTKLPPDAGLRLEIDATDVVTVRADIADVSYTFMGVEEPKDA